ncbi:hypothetical protein V5O48_015952 [Marasmius crinis-equi]|uniref:Uncharacterized protein n=1 Tax=Marasmius crinis-equi TaxID=585013 RepID=A0ABR3ET30_9AGAR
MGIFTSTALVPITAAFTPLTTALYQCCNFSKPKLFVVAILGVGDTEEESSRRMANDFAALHTIISSHPSYAAKHSKWYTVSECEPLGLPRTFTPTVLSSGYDIPHELSSTLEEITQRAGADDKLLLVLLGHGIEEQFAMHVGEYLLRCSELEFHLNRLPTAADVYCLLPTACFSNMMGPTPEHWSVLSGACSKKESVAEDASGFQFRSPRSQQGTFTFNSPTSCFWHNLELDPPDAGRSGENFSAVEPCVSGFHHLQLKWGPNRIITKFGPILRSMHVPRPVTTSSPIPLEPARHKYLLELIKEFKPRERNPRGSNVGLCSLCLRYPRGFDQQHAEELIKKLEAREKQAAVAKAICEAVGWDWTIVGDPYLVREDASWDEARRKALVRGFDIALAMRMARTFYRQRRPFTDLTMWLAAVWEANGCAHPVDWNGIILYVLNEGVPVEEGYW